MGESERKCPLGQRSQKRTSYPPVKCDVLIVWEDDIGLRQDKNLNIRVIELKGQFSLGENPEVKAIRGNVSATDEGLRLIAKGQATKENLLALFNKYHIKERNREPVRFIARLIINGADPYIKDGAIALKKPLNQKITYKVSSDTAVMKQAKALLREIGLNF